MNPVPREPVNTIVERTGKKLGAVIFDGGSPSPDVSRAVHIPHENISKSWKKQKQYVFMYWNRSEPQATPITDPVPPSKTAEDNLSAYDGPDLTPVKFRRMNTFNAHHHGCCPTCSSKDDPRLRCWHFRSWGAVEANRHIADVIHDHVRCIR